ncbi:glycosyltransferase [Gammaproteobacteria bacterium]|nr:glycosyltransferase [Gammaproteobacteria bacterium]
MPLPHLLADPPSGLTVHQLNPMQSVDASFKNLVDEQGRLVDEPWRRRRIEQLLTLIAEIEPELVIIESWPFGRPMLHDELTAMLEGLHQQTIKPWIVASIRDILQQRSDKRYHETLALLERYVDEVWMHADPEFTRLQASFPLADALPIPLRYSGYIDSNRAIPRVDSERRRGVVVSSGGMTNDLSLLRCAIRARPLSTLADEPWRILCGSGVSADQLRELEDLAQSQPGLMVERNRPDFRSLLAAARVSVSQAGYNTCLDVLAAGCSAVLVPFCACDETEQTQRAVELQQRGRVAMLMPDALSPATLAARIDDSLNRTTQFDADRNGVERVVGWVSALSKQ